MVTAAVLETVIVAVTVTTLGAALLVADVVSVEEVEEVSVEEVDEADDVEEVVLPLAAAAAWNAVRLLPGLTANTIPIVQGIKLVNDKEKNTNWYSIPC